MKYEYRPCSVTDTLPLLQIESVTIGHPESKRNKTAFRVLKTQHGEFLLSAFGGRLALAQMVLNDNA